MLKIHSKELKEKSNIEISFSCHPVDHRKHDRIINILPSGNKSLTWSMIFKLPFHFAKREHTIFKVLDVDGCTLTAPRILFL